MIALSRRQHQFVILLLCAVAALLVSLALSNIPHELGMSAAHAQALDAGSAASSAAPVAPTIHDPTQDPAGYLSDLEKAKSNGWGLAILVGVFGLCEVLAAAGKKFPKLAWLGKGRISVAIGAITAITATSIAKLADGGTWMAVAYTAVGAALLYWHPAGTDPAKA